MCPLDGRTFLTSSLLQEDAQLVELKAKGLDWPAVAAEIGGRTDNQVSLSRQLSTSLFGL